MSKLRRKCVYLRADGRPCGRAAVGNPPLCKAHAEEIAGEEMDVFSDAMDRLMDNPDVKYIFGQAGGLIDRIGSFLSFLPEQRGQPSETSEPGHARRPPEQESGPRQRRQPIQQRPTSTARVVLGFSAAEALTRDKIKARQKALAQALHPDRQGGSNEAMARVNQAADLLIKECK